MLMTDSAVKSWLRNWKRAVWIVTLCACLPVFYVLSIGPTVFILHKFGLEDRPLGGAMRAFYSPLINYARQNRDRPEVQLLKKYVEMWGGK